MTSLLVFVLLAQAPAEIEAPGLARSLEGQPGTAQQDTDKAQAPQKEEPPQPPPVVPLVVDVQEQPERVYVPRTFLTLSGIGGLGAGFNIVPFPAPYAGPFGGVGLKLEHKILKASFVTANLDLSLGSNEAGRPIGGYQALVAMGTSWIDARFFVLQSQVRGGIASVLLFPLPQLGVLSTAALQVIRGDVLRWRVGVDLALDFLLFLPIFSSAIFSEARWELDRVHFGLKITGATSVGIPALGASVSAKAFAGLSF